MRARSLSTRIAAGGLTGLLLLGAGFGVAEAGTSARSTQNTPGASPDPVPGRVAAVALGSAGAASAATPGSRASVAAAGDAARGAQAAGASGGAPSRTPAAGPMTAPYATTTVTTPYATKTTPAPTKTTPAPAKTTSGGSVPPAAVITASQQGTTITLVLTLPAAVQSLTYRWGNGVSFGQTKSKTFIAKEIGLRSSTGTALPFSVTALSRPHGQVTLAPRSHTVTALRFTLHVKYLYLTAAERRTLARHHSKVVTSTLSIRLRNGKLYSKSLRYRT